MQVVDNAVDAFEKDITSSRNMIDHWATYRSTAVCVFGKAFMGRHVLFHNIAGPEKRRRTGNSASVREYTAEEEWMLMEAESWPRYRYSTHEGCCQQHDNKQRNIFMFSVEKDTTYAAEVKCKDYTSAPTTTKVNDQLQLKLIRARALERLRMLRLAKLLQKLLVQQGFYAAFRKKVEEDGDLF
nr:pectinesterase, active site-containing protein [Tanacetum cinerariifolium]